MTATVIARIIMDFVLFLELTDGDDLNRETAATMMASLARDVRALDKPFLRELIAALAANATRYGGEERDVVDDIVHAFHLEEALAADGPATLAELEARLAAQGG